MSRAPLRAGEAGRSGPLRSDVGGPRTLVDCAREWPLEDAVVAIDAALLAGRTTLDEVRAAAAAVHHWPGASRAARAAALADGRAESPLETRGRLRIVGAGLPGAPNSRSRSGPTAGCSPSSTRWFDEAAVAVRRRAGEVHRSLARTVARAGVLWDEKRREDGLRGLDIRIVRVADADLGGTVAGVRGSSPPSARDPWAAGPAVHGDAARSRHAPNGLNDRPEPPRDRRSRLVRRLRRLPSSLSAGYPPDEAAGGSAAGVGRSTRPGRSTAGQPAATRPPRSRRPAGECCGSGPRRRGRGRRTAGRSSAPARHRRPRAGPARGRSCPPTTTGSPPAGADRPGRTAARPPAWCRHRRTGRRR